MHQSPTHHQITPPPANAQPKSRPLRNHPAFTYKCPTHNQHHLQSPTVGQIPSQAAPPPTQPPLFHQTSPQQPSHQLSGLSTVKSPPSQCTTANSHLSPILQTDREQSNYMSNTSTATYSHHYHLTSSPPLDGHCAVLLVPISSPTHPPTLLLTKHYAPTTSHLRLQPNLTKHDSFFNT